MTPQHMKALIWSLAWCAHSHYHAVAVRELLADAYPDTDFTGSLTEFERITGGRLTPETPQEGRPE